jgi:hypothetical protein
MTLLDRFRGQPRQRHADPAVRLAFVQEIPLHERDLLGEIAREDRDARVRRAAVSKLMDPAALAVVARNDADEDIRGHAAAMLRDLALEVFEGVVEADTVAAVDALAALSDVKALAAVAKSAPSAVVADRARSHVTDGHLLGSIARHSAHETVRREAFNALKDPRDVLGVALNSEFREPTLAAVERITDREALEQIALRARNRSAAKRARAIVREIENREALDREASAVAAAEAARGAQPVGTAAAVGFQGAPPVAVHHTVVDADAARPAGRPEGPVSRGGAGGPGGLGGNDGNDAAAAEGKDRREAEDKARREAAERARREAAEKETERARLRLAELATEAVRLATLDDLAAARRQFAILRTEWNDLSARTRPDASIAARYAEADAAFAARDAAAREADRQARAAALARLQQLLVRVEPLAGREELMLRAGDRALHDVRAALAAIPPLPLRQDHEEIVRRLKAVQAALMPRVQELREVASWQRWANVGIQEQLCEKMEALTALDNAEEIAHRVKELQQQWRQAADVPRAQGEALWKRFKAAHDEAWAKCQAHFAAQAEVRAGNLAKKTALCERAEALADSTNWIQTAEEIKRLQAEWKTIGPVSRGQEKTIWERFRAACDRFFTRRHADLVERKKVWAQNLAKKEALIAKVEALAESTDWDPAAVEIKRVQAEWKTIGPVKKSRSEALWLRFRGACDRFFTRYAQRHDVARNDRIAAREAIVVEMEAIDVAGDAPPPDLLAKVRDLRARWQHELAARGVDRERAIALEERFATASQRVMERWPSAFVGTDLDPDANRKRMESLVHRIEDLATSLAGPPDAPAEGAVSAATRLAAMLKESWAANTIGRADTESRFRAAQEEVRRAQSAWSRIGPVPDDARQALTDRFQRAIRRISERVNANRLVGARR